MQHKRHKRQPQRIHTRKIDRMVARNEARNKGYTKINKNNWFALNWKQFVTD